MNESIRRWLRRVGLSLGVGAAGLLPAQPGWSQELPAPPPPAAAEAAEDAADRVDSAQDAREETRELRRETRGAARDAAENQREAARETRDEAQDAVEARREAGRAREAVRDGDVAPNARTRVGEAAEATRDGAREAGRDAAATARDAAGAARDAAQNVRQGARASVQANQQAGADFRVSDYRSADFGLWFDRSVNEGLVISDVATTGLIADLGFVAGDRIVSINGRPVASEAQFMDFVFAPQFRDQRVQVIVDRAGVQETIVLEPSALIRELVMVQEEPLEELGIVLDDRYNDRALVWRVTRRSPAFYAGIRPGDTITAINRQRVATAEDAHQAAANLGDGPVVIQVSRGDRFRDVQVELVPSERREVRVEGELAPPTPPVTPQAAVPAAPSAPVVNPAQPAPNVVVPVEPRNATPRATRPVRPGLLPRFRQR
jgi:C-terminal processing protease CtpA/Prc